MKIVPAAVPRDISAALAAGGDRLRPIAETVYWYEEITSTNDVAREIAEAGAPEGCVVIADAQSKGRGRHGRAWVSPPGLGIYASVLLRPPAHARSMLTLAAGVALADGIGAATGLQVGLKWPNDVYSVADPRGRGRKLAGILAEGGGAGDRLDYVVLGFGVNVGDSPKPRVPMATSLELELGRPVDRALVLTECLAAWRDRYEALKRGEVTAMVAAWRQRAVLTLGRRVEWEANGVTCRGIAEDIGADGALLVRAEQGPMRVVAGEVRWRDEPS